MNTTITRISRTTLEVPFREIPARNLQRELPHWRYVEIVEVELEGGAIGFGETLLYYTWDVPTVADFARAEGNNAAELMWDDSLGAGLQMALFDAVGKALDVPVHRLLGQKVRDRTPVSWWCIDMPAEDWVAEGERAVASGYTDMKVKGRPWFDIRHQFETLAGELPSSFDIDIDFNETGLDAENAVPLLRELEQYPLVNRFEGPIPQEDIGGNERIHSALDTDIVLHYGRPDPLVAIRRDICDGFILTGGANQLIHNGAVAAMADKPLWLQLVGTDLTAAFSVHCAAVLERAEWPAINCHQIYEESLLVDSLTVSDGHTSVPDGPGLGYEIDEATIERLRCDRPESRPYPRRLVESSWGDGPTIYFSGNNDELVNYAREAGQMPYFTRDVTTRLVPDDGSDRWQRLYERALDAPFVSDSGEFEHS